MMASSLPQPLTEEEKRLLLDGLALPGELLRRRGAPFAPDDHAWIKRLSPLGSEGEDGGGE